MIRYLAILAVMAAIAANPLGPSSMAGDMDETGPLGARALSMADLAFATSPSGASFAAQVWRMPGATADSVIVKPWLHAAQGQEFYIAGYAALALPERDLTIGYLYGGAGHEAAFSAGVGHAQMREQVALPTGAEGNRSVAFAVPADSFARPWLLMAFSYSSLETSVGVEVQGLPSAAQPIVAGDPIAANWFDFEFQGAEATVPLATAAVRVEASHSFASNQCLAGIAGSNSPPGGSVGSAHVSLEGPMANLHGGPEAWFLAGVSGSWTLTLQKTGLEEWRNVGYLALVPTVCDAWVL